MCDELFHVPLNHKTKAIRKIGLKLGNKYLHKNHFLSLMFYNQVISHAKSRINASLGYANRSTVYFNLKMYDECLQNIQLARENYYPEEKYPQIDQLEIECEKALLEPTEDKFDPWKIFKLSYTANKKVPWVVDCVEVKTTEKYGRGIYATRDLQPGDIICIEDIIVNFRDRNYEYSHCYNCYKANALNLIHCDLTGHMMFCSPACRDDLYCKAINIDGIVSVDVKILSDIAKVFGSAKKFDDLMKDIDIKELNKTIFDFDFSNSEDPDFQKNLIISFLSLAPKDDPSFGDCCDIYNYISKEAAERILSVFNLNRKRSFVFVNKTEYLQVGCHISLFASLINHSCLNNASPILVDNKIVTVIENPIKAGEQIFFNYMCDTPTNKTLRSVEEFYEFKCGCRLCTAPEWIPQMTLRWKIPHAINEEKLDILPTFEITDYDQVQSYLKEKWNDIKELPIEQKYNSVNSLYPLALLDYIAAKVAYPFLL